ncbi:MAG: FAD-dependent oxidoreductase, partial [Prochlorococcaceae cyanobacterium]
PLLEGGWIEPWPGRFARLNAEGALHPHPGDHLMEGRLFRGRGGMDQLCQGLLQLAGERVELHVGTLVRHLSVTPTGRWQWFDGNHQLLGEADWLVLSGTLLAHPRSQRLLGWEEPPLQPVARSLGDPQLTEALAAIAALAYEPRFVLMLLIDASRAQRWQPLPFRLLGFEPGAQKRWGLERLSLQPLEDGRCAVVVHSTAAFASRHLNVFGSGAAIADLSATQPSSEQEQAVIAELEAALQQALEPWISPWGAGDVERQLMRWGAAFAQPPGLPAELMLCPRNRIGFCGDGLEGPGFGRVEGALLSGERLARRLVSAT